MNLQRQDIFLYVLGVFVFSVLSGLLFFQVPIGGHRDIDSGAYLQAAQFFLEDGSFHRIDHAPYYGLGYPLFLVMIFKLFGGNPAGLVISQGLLAIAIAFLCRRISYNLFNETAAWVAYFFAVTHAGLLVFTQFILTEILLVFFLALAVDQLILFLKQRKLRPLFIAGLALGFSCVVKAVALPFVIILYLAGIFFLRRNVVVSSLVFVLPFVCVTGLYAAYKNCFFKPSNRTMGFINLCYWYYPHLRAAINNSTSDIERNFVQRIEDKTVVLSMVRHDVMLHPKLAFFALVKNWTKTLFGLYSSNLKLLVDNQFFWGGKSFFLLNGTIFEQIQAYIEGRTSLAWVKVASYFELIVSILKYFFFIIGGVVLFLRRKYAELIFLFLYMGYFIGITGHDGCARFRMMVDVLILGVAAGGCAVGLPVFWRKVMSNIKRGNV